MYFTILTCILLDSGHSVMASYVTRVQWGSVCYYVGDVFWREHRTAGWLAEPALISVLYCGMC